MGWTFKFLCKEPQNMLSNLTPRNDLQGRDWVPSATLYPKWVESKNRCENITRNALNHFFIDHCELFVAVVWEGSGGICGWDFREKVTIPSTKPHITMQGAGMNATIIIGNDTAENSGGTEHSATVSIYADHFTAMDMGFKVRPHLSIHKPHLSWNSIA